MEKTEIRHTPGHLFFFHKIQKECLLEAARIRERNSAYEFRYAGENYRFDAGEYLDEAELKTYERQLIADHDPVKIKFIDHNYCLCEFTKFTARWLTSQINQIKYLESIKKKAKKK